MNLGVPSKLINLIRMTLAKMGNKLRVAGVQSSYFQMERGLRQSAPLSTLLFNISMEKIIRDKGQRNEQIGHNIYEVINA